ncbi:LysR family transcriptional regulator [Lichenihabitans sp. PAMC28606]|uniref:LysR substrate-binding domain-containing protein n=1 Tax=Lichenihabitans sp. PAMC28606 TaxID=2880932 RepID=UPI001D09B044|nr:LysR substrate-binding domain-containing protein [Lichenihabitans sp. PAMC28606]UDL94395.1 LysR family transcriptional regulator [Lichenihabitans sp. PAMC28606]
MQRYTNLDMDTLRTFVTGFELGSFVRAAERLGRSPSAISTQLKKLEAQVGQSLVAKAGRGLALTAAGESLLGYAKRLLDLNDEAVERLRGANVEGWARLGLPQDFAEAWLPAVLTRFARAHPKVRIEVQVDRTVPLIEKTLKGELDLTLAWDDGARAPYAEHVADVPIHWIGRPDWPGVASLGGEPLPFVAFQPPCTFRSAAVAALNSVGMPWRVVFTSPSLAGLLAAAEGGLGITARTSLAMPKAFSVLDPAASGLPALPDAPLSLHVAEAEPPPAVARLKEILLETLAMQISEGRVGPARALAQGASSARVPHEEA